MSTVGDYCHHEPDVPATFTTRWTTRHDTLPGRRKEAQGAAVTDGAERTELSRVRVVPPRGPSDDAEALARWEDDGGRPRVGKARHARASPSNAEIARTLEHVASLLEAQDANPYRVVSYRNAARTAREVGRPLAVIFDEETTAGLEHLPSIGPSLASAIAELVETGHLGLLDRLEGRVPAERLFATIPGIGSALAQRVHTKLGIESLEELEAAAHDGRLERLPGFGPRRARAVREVLASRLARSAARRSYPALPGTHPSVHTLLGVDRKYRELAGAGKLRRIAPRRFNPSGKAWLPILHTEREGWAFTALYSNTARAHALGTTNDWVILFYERDGAEDRCTIVTEKRGPLAGLRVVRGRERECRAWYRADSEPPRARDLVG